MFPKSNYFADISFTFSHSNNKGFTPVESKFKDKMRSRSQDLYVALYRNASTRVIDVDYMKAYYIEKSIEGTLPKAEKPDDFDTIVSFYKIPLGSQDNFYSVYPFIWTFTAGDKPHDYSLVNHCVATFNDYENAVELAGYISSYRARRTQHYESMPYLEDHQIPERYRETTVQYSYTGSHQTKGCFIIKNGVLVSCVYCFTDFYDRDLIPGIVIKPEE